MQSPWIQGSHRIPLDPKGSHWIPLVSTDLAWYKWSTDPLSPSGSTVLVGHTDPTEFPRPAAVLLDPGCPWMQGSHRIPLDPTRSLWVPVGSTRCCLSKSTVSLDPRIPPDPTGCQWIPMDSTGFHGPSTGYTWLSVPPGSYWIHGVLASTDPTGFLRLAAGLLRPW